MLSSKLSRMIRHTLWMGAVAAISSPYTSTALAATASENNKDTMDEVVITGSSIRRVEAEGSLPVQVFTTEDIARSGTTSVTDFLQQLPAMQGFTTASDSVGGTGGGVTTASLHDVGDQYTLVLLNGRRVAPSDSGTTIDLNSIPLAAIQRIDVLTDGASAVYGADAIAGVVNFVLKQGQAPLEFTARTSRPQHKGGEQVNFSLSKGFGNLHSDGYSVFIAASYDKIQPLAASQRDFSKSGIFSGKLGTLNYDFFNGSSRSVPPNVDVFFTDKTSTSLSPYLLANGSCPPSHLAIGSQCYFDYASTVEIAPQIQRTALYGSGKFALGDSGWNIFTDLAYTDVGTLTRIAPYPAEFGVSTTSSAYTTYILPYLTPTQAGMVSSINVKYRLYDLGNRTTEYKTKALHFVGGTEGKIAGWDVSASLTVSNQTQDQNYLEGWPLAAPFTAALTSGSIDPFPYQKGAMPASMLQALKATQFKGTYDTTKIGMTGVDLNAQHGLFKMGGGDFILSLGADYHDNSYKHTPQPVAANADILFDDPQPSFDLSRNSMGAYGEILAPITKELELTAAARYDRISGVTDKASHTKFGSSENATTFKLGGKWQPLSTLAVRASYGTGFRVATMKEIAQPKVDFGVTGGTYNCPFSSSYDPLGYFAAGYICASPLQYEEFQSGNPKLKPEQSKQWNLGLILQPTSKVSMGLDYWSVSIKDAVSSVDESLIMHDPAKYLSLYTTKFKSSNGLTYVAIIDAPINIGRTENEGIDWDFSYTQDLSFGSVQTKLAGTYMVKSRYTLPGTDDQWTTSLNKYGVDSKVAFRNLVTLSTSLHYGNWEHTLQVHYRDGYTDKSFDADADCMFYDDNGTCFGGALTIPSLTTFDWRTAWDMTKNVSVVLGIENMFDKAPPRSLRSTGSHQLGYDPRYASPYLRTFVLSASVKY